MKLTTLYEFTCHCCNKKISLSNFNNSTFSESGWNIISYCYTDLLKRQVPDKVICKDCLETERLKKYNSDDVKAKCEVGYYRDHPENFSEEVIEYVGLKGHPKAGKAFSMAYERGHSSGHFSVLSELEELAQLLL
jgi:hypothetical protein